VFIFDDNIAAVNATDLVVRSLPVWCCVYVHARKVLSVLNLLLNITCWSQFSGFHSIDFSCKVSHEHWII